MQREQLAERSATMGDRLRAGLVDAFAGHPHVGDIRAGKGLLAAVEIVEDRDTKKNFGADRKVARLVQTEMMARGIVTRTRPTAGAHPAPGDIVCIAPPLVVRETEVDRIVAVTRDAINGVVG
jgi:L-2,4-diaminobutyrate transaminase